MAESICKECGAPVNWGRTNNQWSCTNPDGSDHWDLCSQLKFERIKRTGKAFDHGDTKGYRTEFKRSGVQLTYESGGVIRGANYKPSGDCAQCCEPWEVCSWPCPDAIA